MAEYGFGAISSTVKEWEKRKGGHVFRIIFRVPSLDEIDQGTSVRKRANITNLASGPGFQHGYTLSEPDLDLAIISLDRGGSMFSYSAFGDELERLGHEPIGLEDVSDGPSSEGADVFAVGFPGATAILDQVPMEHAERNWSSDLVSLPTYAWGRVSMLHPDLDFFWCDMSVYPGNSGGPVVEDGKLVGIVSSQAYIKTENGLDETRIPFGNISKTRSVKEMLQTQIQKDSQSIGRSST